MSTKQMQIAERARKNKGSTLTNLHQFIDLGLLKESYHQLNKKSIPGVDSMGWLSYGHKLDENLRDLLNGFKSGSYRAPNLRRVYISKGKNGKRPLGVPTIEDKVLQESVRRVLTPIYEEDFKSFSFGFRQGLSAHDAIDYLFKEVSFKGLYYIIDADIKDFFGSVDHGILRGFLERRVKDGVVRKMLDKWLKAGVMESGTVHYPEKGTPQGGIISPLLGNIYLHHVLDEWFSEEVQPLLTGKSSIVRYADDFVLAFENSRDAERVMNVLPKRFAKYKLELHGDKTHLIDLTVQGGKGWRSFDFLGFSHYLGKSRKGKLVLKRKTSKKKFTLALEKIKNWIKKNRHEKLGKFIPELNVKLRGHYNYYGITFNYRGINRYYECVKRILQKWLNRRGGKPIWEFGRFAKLINEWIPLLRPKLYHSYR